MLLRMGEISAWNMLSWLELLINRYCYIYLVVYIIVLIILFLIYTVWVICLNQQLDSTILIFIH